MERGVAGVMVSTPTTMKGRDTLSKSTVCGVASGLTWRKTWPVQLTCVSKTRILR